MTYGCWRGYKGTWEIKNERLYLIDLDGNGIIAPNKKDKIDMQYLFPSKKKYLLGGLQGKL